MQPPPTLEIVEDEELSLHGGVWLDHRPSSWHHGCSIGMQLRSVATLEGRQTSYRPDGGPFFGSRSSRTDAVDDRCETRYPEHQRSAAFHCAMRSCDEEGQRAPDGDEGHALRLERPSAPVSVAPRGRRRWAAGGPSYALSPSASQGIFQQDPGGRLYFPIVADGGLTPRRLHAADQPVVALFCHSGYSGVFE